MSLWQGRSRRKASGGMYHKARSKRARETGSDPVYTRVGAKNVGVSKRMMGGREKSGLITAAIANLNLGNNKFKQAKIKTVKENPSNRHFVRMNVISRGAVIETEEGLARVTSKPTQDGVVNAVLAKK